MRLQRLPVHLDPMPRPLRGMGMAVDELEGLDDKPVEAKTVHFEIGLMFKGLPTTWAEF